MTLSCLETTELLRCPRPRSLHSVVILILLWKALDGSKPAKILDDLLAGDIHQKRLVSFPFGSEWIHLASLGILLFVLGSQPSRLK